MREGEGETEGESQKGREEQREGGREGNVPFTELGARWECLISSSLKEKRCPGLPSPPASDSLE